MQRRSFTWGLLSLAALAACGSAAVDDPDPEEAHVLDGQPVVADDGKADGAALPGALVRLVVDAGAVPGSADHPNVVVYIPGGYDASHPNVVVFFHGWYNCAANVVRARNGTCGPGHPARNAYNLAGQLEASRKNAILVVPELAYEQPSSDPGQLAEADRFYRLLDEVLAQLGDQIGGAGVWDVDQIIVASHSGGYLAAADSVTAGGLWTNEIWLLDSLYDNRDDFDGWVTADDNHDGFTAAPPTRRFATVYTLGGGTLANSQAMAARARGWFADRAPIVDDRSGATLTDAQLAHGLVFKRSWLGHDDVPRYYFGRLLATSGLPVRPGL